MTSYTQDSVRVRSLVDPIIARWWLVFTAMLVGGLVGLGIHLTRSLTFEGRALVSMGQPVNVGGQPVATPTATITTIKGIAAGQEAMQKAHDASGIPVEKLRSSVSVTASGTTSQANRQGLAPVVSIRVQGSNREDVTRATNALARHLVAKTSGSAVKKREALEQHRDEIQREISSLRENLAHAERIYDTLSASGLQAVDRALATMSAATVLTQQQIELRNAREDQLDVTHDLDLNQLVETSSVLSEARAARLAATSRTGAIMVGLLIGAIAGVLLALLLGGRRQR